MALLMANEPDFIHVWFGLAKLVAFLSSNIHSHSLLHCFRSCEPRALVVGAGRVWSVVHFCRMSVLPVKPPFLFC